MRDIKRDCTDDGITKGHPCCEACAKVCLDREYDQPSFDPTYNSDSVERLVPLVAEVFGRMPFWWEPKDKAEEKLGPKARLAVGYSLTIRD